MKRSKIVDEKAGTLVKQKTSFRAQFFMFFVEHGTEEGEVLEAHGIREPLKIDFDIRNVRVRPLIIQESRSRSYSRLLSLV